MNYTQFLGELGEPFVDLIVRVDQRSEVLNLHLFGHSRVIVVLLDEVELSHQGCALFLEVVVPIILLEILISSCSHFLESFGNSTLPVLLGLDDIGEVFDDKV